LLKSKILKEGEGKRGVFPFFVKAFFFLCGEGKKAPHTRDNSRSLRRIGRETKKGAFFLYAYLGLYKSQILKGCKGKRGGFCMRLFCPSAHR